MENLKCCLNTSSPDCIFWPSVKLCFCIKERGVYIRAEKKSSKIYAQTWQYVVPSFLVFPEPSTALFTSPCRALGCPPAFFFFSRFLSLKHMFYHQSLLSHVFVVLLYLGGLTCFPSTALVVAAWRKSLHLFLHGWCEEQQKHCSCEDLWSTHTQVPVGYPIQPHALPTKWRSSIFPWGWRWQCKPVPIPSLLKCLHRFCLLQDGCFPGRWCWRLQNTGISPCWGSIPGLGEDIPHLSSCSLSCCINIPIGNQLLWASQETFL